MRSPKSCLAGQKLCFVGERGRRGVRGWGWETGRLCQTSMNHLDVFWVVGDEQRRAIELCLSQVALMLRLQIRSPLYRELKSLFSLLQKLNSICVAQPCKGLCHDVLQDHTALLPKRIFRFRNVILPWQSKLRDVWGQCSSTSWRCFSRPKATGRSLGFRQRISTTSVREGMGISSLPICDA